MELLDVYDDNAKRTGRIVVRGDKDEVFAPNEHIAVSIIFIENSEGKFLIQKTVKGEYSSTGGHIDHDEEPDDVIIREVKEELGINIDIKEVVKLGYRLFDFPLRFLYYLKKDIDIKEIKIQESEVSSVEYMSVSDINNLIDNNLMNKGHAMLFKEILKYKGEENGK